MSIKPRRTILDDFPACFHVPHDRRKHHSGMRGKAAHGVGIIDGRHCTQKD